MPTSRHGWQFVSTHSRPKAAGTIMAVMLECGIVSTHSRPKAAGAHTRITVQPDDSFNSQPPEGGWCLR